MSLLMFEGYRQAVYLGIGKQCFHRSFLFAEDSLRVRNIGLVKCCVWLKIQQYEKPNGEAWSIYLIPHALKNSYANAKQIPRIAV